MGLISRIFDRAVAMAVAGAVLPARVDAEPPQAHPAPVAAAGGGGGWQNAMTGMGYGRDPATATTYGYQMVLPDTVRDNLYEFEAMTGIVIDRPAQDLVRRRLAFKGFEGFDTVRIESKLDDLEMHEKISRAYKWARKDGGSAIFCIVNDGRPNVAPIDYQRLTNVHALHVLTRREISVAQWNWDPTTRGFGKPLFYYIHTPGVRSAANLIHADRVIRFVNGDLSHQAMMRHNGWGISVIDRIWQPLRAKGSALAAVSSILTSYAVDVVKIKGLAEALKMGAKEEMQQRADLMRYTLGNLSKIFLDAEGGEDFTPLVRSAAGLAEIVGLMIDEFQAATWIPKSILRGLSPGGLGDGENAGEVRAYYDFIGGEQGVHYVPPATRVTDLVLRSRFGPTMGEAPEHWYLEPKPLWTPSDTERASIREAHARARTSDIAAGLISVAEGRTDPDLAEHYDLDDEDMEDSAGEETLFPDGETPVSTAKAAKMFGVRPQSIVTMIQNGTIGHYKLNGRYVVSQQEILRAVKGAAAGEPPTAALPAPAPAGAEAGASPA